MISDYLKNYKVLLASGSKRRHELLRGLEINFKSITHNIKEFYPNELKGSQITDFISKKKISSTFKWFKKKWIIDYVRHYSLV